MSKFPLNIFFCALLLAATSARAADFTPTSIHEVEQFVSSNGITTLEELLPRLSAEFRSSFVLMRKSLSLQPTKNPLTPRVLLFGRNGQLVLAFSRDANSLELMEKQPGATDFQFQRINFVAGKPPTTQNNCQACHQGHPIWGQYGAWPGMYGGDQEKIPQGSREEADYLQFTKSAPGDSLYRNLIFKCGTYYNGGIVPGYVTEGNCATVASLLGGTAGEERARLERRYQQPAEGFGELLNRHNADRIFLRMHQAENYPALRYALAANTLGCLGERMYDYSPDDAARDLVRRALLPRAQPILDRIQAQADAKGLPAGRLQERLLGLLGVNVAADLRLDLKTPKRSFLGNDCDENDAYAPNPACRKGAAGYSSYSDGTDHAPGLLGYLALREIYTADPVVREKLRAGLAATESYFRSLPPGSGSGYDNVNYILAYLRPVMADLEQPSANPAAIPKYIQDYPFSRLLRWGHGEEICGALLERAN